MSNAPHFDIDVPAFWADPYPALAKMRGGADRVRAATGSTVFTRRDGYLQPEKRTDVFSSHQPAGLMNTPDGPQHDAQDGDAHMSERAAMFPRCRAHGARHLEQGVSGPCRPHPRGVRAHRWRRSLQGVRKRLVPLSAEC